MKWNFLKTHARQSTAFMLIELLVVMLPSALDVSPCAIQEVPTSVTAPTLKTFIPPALVQERAPLRYVPDFMQFQS
jgi:hypothetical protein